ncbi:MAG TPA: hypothetical protein VGJ92_06185, partial [Methanocella sp.]
RRPSTPFTILTGGGVFLKAFSCFRKDFRFYGALSNKPGRQKGFTIENAPQCNDITARPVVQMASVGRCVVAAAKTFLFLQARVQCESMGIYNTAVLSG